MNIRIFIWTLLECFFVWKVKPSLSSELNTAQAIVCQSFGLSPNGKEPGLTNKMLGQRVSILKDQKRQLLILAQWEVADSLVNFRADFQVDKSRQEGRYLDSREVTAQMVDHLRYEKIQRLIIVAHPWHIWRVKRLFEKEGFVCLVPARSGYGSFNASSGQWWTRNAFLWIVREIPARLFSLVRGWI